MKRKLASIQKVAAVNPIPEADKIVRADILGWHLAAKKGEFQVGSLAVYCEIDSLLPVRPEFEFLRKNCYKPRVNGFRIKTLTMRGQISQGIAFPMSILEGRADVASLKEGDDVTDALGVVKYEEPIPKELEGEVVGSFSAVVPETDEARIQSCPQLLQRHASKLFYVTEKMDGASSTFFLRDNEFGVCGRQWQYTAASDNIYNAIAKRLNLADRLKGQVASGASLNMAIQGEIVGPGTNGPTYLLKEPTLLLYNVFDIDHFRYLDFSNFIAFARQLGVPTVPVLEVDFTLPNTVDELVEHAAQKSALNVSMIREGVVLRPLVEVNDVEIGRLSFKVVTPKYLLGREVNEQ